MGSAAQQERRTNQQEIRIVGEDERYRRAVPQGRPENRNRRVSQGRTEYREGMERRRMQEERRRRKRRARRLFLLWQGVFFVAVVLLFLDIGIRIKNSFGDNQEDIASVWQDGAEVSDVQGNHPAQSAGGEVKMDYVELCGLEQVDKPIKREPYEVLARLEELGQESGTIAVIYENRQRYPDNLLEALANNPEMADFVEGYPSAAQEASGGLTEREREQEHPLFLQWDPRWGYAPYGDNSNIGLAGCGPVSLSMALYYLTGDESLTPDKIAAYSMENGYYMSGTGTMWALMTDVPALYGVKASNPGISEQSMKRELDEGHVIICAMRPGDFTATGHFIVIYGYDKTGFLVSDPNCVARSRQSWSFERIGGQIKNLWSLAAGENKEKGHILVK